MNDKWLAANPIPGDKTSWGPWDVLALRTLGIQRQLAERAAGEATPTGIEKIVGDFWVSGMDEARVNAQGMTPLNDRLAAIDALRDGPAIAEYLRKVAARGENPLFIFFPTADFKNSSMNLAYAAQGGLGLPDKNYYFDADKKPIREAYEKHIAKVLELSGIAGGAGGAQAKAVVAFETRLAHASKSQEDLSRDVSLYYNPTTPAAADKLTPNFSWTAFFEAQGIAAPEKFSLAIPAFHQEVSRMLASVPVAQWQSYLRYHAGRRRVAVPERRFRHRAFRVPRQDAAGQKEQRPRWKRVLGTIDGSAGEAMGQLYVDVAFPASSKVAHGGARRQPARGSEGTDRAPGLDDRRNQKKALEKWSTFTPKIGYPDKWRDWTGLATQRDSYSATCWPPRSSTTAGRSARSASRSTRPNGA